MTKRTIALLCAAILLGGAGPSRAETVVDGSDPEIVRELTAGYGSAILDTDNVGDPMISARILGTRYSVFFYGCDDAHANCRSVQFRSVWSGQQIGIDAINAWNLETRFGKAYLDGDGNAVLEFDVNLYHGVSQRNFDDTIDYWRFTLADFASRVMGEPGEDGPEAPTPTDPATQQPDWTPVGFPVGFPAD